LAAVPLLEALVSSSSPIVLKGLNLAAFALNVAAVSVPGRLDGQQDNAMRGGEMNPNTNSSPNEDDALINGSDAASYNLHRSRTLVNPSGWAFAIWGPIYLGEAAFVTSQLFASNTTLDSLNAILPNVTGPFVAANVLQSLWCASFRPSYGDGWKKHVSVAMLGGTAYSLSLITTAASQSYFLYPMLAHFGWTSAATLVNLNGSVGSDKTVSPRTITALGHSSAVIATALGVGITITQSVPLYGFTLSWALAACGDGMSKRKATHDSDEEKVLNAAATVQKKLCFGGSALCAIAAAYASLF
jgi:hypothetical protein